MPSHDLTRFYALFALLILFRIDPSSAQAAAVALPLWEVLNRTDPAR